MLRICRKNFLNARKDRNKYDWTELTSCELTMSPEREQWNGRKLERKEELSYPNYN